MDAGWVWTGNRANARQLPALLHHRERSERWVQCVSVSVCVCVCVSICGSVCVCDSYPHYSIIGNAQRGGYSVCVCVCDNYPRYSIIGNAQRGGYSVCVCVCVCVCVITTLITPS